MADADERLRRRAERERVARLQAEVIAERAIADLIKVNQGLDDLVAERTADLEAALARASVADEVKSTFLRGVAHEMATPLHAISGLVEMMEQTQDPDQIRASASEAGRAAERLHGALRTLVEFAAVSAGQVSTSAEPLVLGDYGERLASRHRIAAARRGLLFMVEAAPDPSVRVEIDSVRLDQIADALIDNAIRFGHSRVAVSITRLEVPESVLELVVQDDGPGPPIDLRATVFEAFVRGERGGHEGFGVGLTLARMVTDALHGSLELSPIAETPARFVARLPVPASES